VVGDRPHATGGMRTLLICHQGAPLHEEGIARWLAAGSTLAGVLVIAEGPGALLRRARRQVRRVGLLRFFDVVAFRAYYRAVLRRGDAAFEAELLESLRARFPAISEDVPRLVVASPNSAEAESFIRRCAPDVTLALCKNLLRPAIFGIPSHGTYVLHPGICPEYRNAHGCFWALAERDLENVGMTLLRIDEGIDTGPVYGYFRCAFDEVRESHLRIQHRMTFDNLDDIMRTLQSIADGRARRIDTTGRHSATWGQPWLSRYLRWKVAARRRRHARHRVAVP
jgi:hypothetical protein